VGAAVVIGDIMLTGLPILIFTILHFNLAGVSVDFSSGFTQVIRECALFLKMGLSFSIHIRKVTLDNANVVAGLVSEASRGFKFSDECFHAGNKFGLGTALLFTVHLNKGVSRASLFVLHKFKAHSSLLGFEFGTLRSTVFIDISISVTPCLSPNRAVAFIQFAPSDLTSATFSAFAFILGIGDSFLPQTLFLFGISNLLKP
jgi:hypothetical protein